MNMKNLKIILIAFLFGAAIFSIIKYISSIKEKDELVKALDKIKVEVASLQGERQNILQELDRAKNLQQQLTQENTGLRDNLKASEDKLAGLNADFAKAKQEIEKLNSEISAWKAENAALKEENAKFDQVAKERDELKAKLSSIDELKKTIRDLKQQMRQVKVEIKQEAAKVSYIIEGNRGYLIKDGKPTCPTKLRIEVTPAPAAPDAK
jgi:chromosome segregation ATPase